MKPNTLKQWQLWENKKNIVHIKHFNNIIESFDIRISVESEVIEFQLLTERSRITGL